MRKSNIVLILIVLLGLFLRIVALGTVPSGFSPDEASQGYTAYSIINTGKDEWGISNSISSFKSFLDYKATLQTYLMVPTIAVFGLNQFAVRLPSAIFGVLAILSVFLLTKELFPDKKHIPYLSAFFLSISPWHIQFSRMALEVNLASFLFPMGLYFFIKGINNNSKWYTYSVLCWGTALYSYHAARLFIPLFVIFLLIFNSKKIISLKFKEIIIPLILVLIIIFPIAKDMFLGQSAKRGADVSITNLSVESIKKINDEVYYSDLYKINPFIPRLFHNKITTIATQFTENYLTYFSLPFWFTEGGREITYSVIPGRGLLYFWELPLVLIGLYLLIKEKNKQTRAILIAWLLLAAIPAALTKEGYRPNRAGSYLVYWEMISATGMSYFLTLRFKFKKIFMSAFIVLSLLITIFYFEDYYFNSKVNFPKTMSYGWKPAISYILQNESKYQKVYIDRGSQAQSFVAFYKQIDPNIFQKNSQVWQKLISQNKDIQYLDQIPQYNLENYTFKNFNWPEDANKNSLYLWQGNSSIPDNRHTLYQVKTPQNETIIEVFDFRK